MSRGRTRLPADRRPGAAPGTGVPALPPARKRAAAQTVPVLAAPVPGAAFEAVTVLPPSSRAPDREATQADRTVTLVERAVRGAPRSLPHLESLQVRFGRPLGHLRAHVGPDVTAALRALGARAATRGADLLFADEHPDLVVVAHEVVHALQADRAQTPGVESVAAEEPAAEPTAEAAAVETEAADVAEAVTSASRDADVAAPIAVRGHLAPGTFALLREDAPTLDPPDSAAALVEQARQPRREAAPPTAPSPRREAPASVPAEGAGRGRSGREPADTGPSGRGAQASPPVPDDEGSGFELPPAPEPGVSAEDVAAREADLAAAEAALTGASDVSGLVDGFAGAPPSLKARSHADLGAQADSLAQDEARALESSLPDLRATMSSDVDVDAAPDLVVAAPASQSVVIEDSPAPAPEPDVPEVPDPGAFTANEGLGGGLDRRLGGDDPSARADGIGESLREVATTDPEIPRSPGPAPVVPLAGETDPERLADLTSGGVEAGRAARDEARQAVVDGPGPERARARALDESVRVEGLQAPTLTPPGPVEDADAYVAMGLPPEVETAFDSAQQESMQASLAGAVGQAEQAATDRDESRRTAVEAAEADVAEQSRQADEDQRVQVGTARETIQRERQKTVDAQQAAVAEVETDAEDRSAQDRGAIEDRVAQDQDRIDQRYDSAATDTDAKVAAGERDAAAEKENAERDAEDQSWWDRAVNFVRRAFDALVSAIGKIFDAVRSAVNGILEAARDFATGLIDAAAAFVKDAIKAYGEFLAAAVDGLLGDVFPELAEALTEAIDAAVESATALVDTVAEGLKAGVNAVVEGLKAGLNAIIDAYQAAIDLALAAVQAALTGDWSALARKVLEAVLAVAGIDPQQFYAFIGRAEETFQIILDDPGAFLGNLVDGFLGGVRQFAGNFLQHLQAGIIGWLTGALGSAGITLPERFDLWGVLDLARQILGLTWERLRRKAVDLIGERNVERLEYVASWIETLVTEGWAGLWQRIQDSLASLRDQVLDGIKTFLLERVVMAAITKIASLFSPVGALVQLVISAWNLFQFLRDQLQRIYSVVQAVLDAIGDIARGILDPAKNKVEEVLARLLPLAIDLLARLLGLGNVGGKVREIIERVQAVIDRALDALIRRVLAAFTGGGRAAAAQDGGAPSDGGASAGPSGAVDETLRIAGEDHTLRVASTEGGVVLLMASGPFDPLLGELGQLMRNLRTIYLERGRPGFVGNDLIPVYERDFQAIEAFARDLTASIRSAENTGDQKEIGESGVRQLKEMLNALHLEEAIQPLDDPIPAPTSRPVLDPLGRPKSYEVDPISIKTLRGRGSVSRPGLAMGLGLLKQVPGFSYHEGHLVAGSLGGPDTADNLVSMSAEANLRKMPSPESKARNLIRRRSGVEAAPGYAFSYRTCVSYGPVNALEAELVGSVGATPGVEGRLFALARSPVGPTDPQLRSALRGNSAAAPAPATSTPGVANVALHVRRRLAWHFLPREFSVTYGRPVVKPTAEDQREVSLFGNHESEEAWPPIINHEESEFA